MRISVHDWSGGRLLEGTPYASGQVLEGTDEDAARIAVELFRAGRNVMILRRPERDEGARGSPRMVPPSVVIAVDDRRFQQR